MAKIFFKFIFLLLVTFIILVSYVSYFGVETDKFDNLIKNKDNEVNQYTQLDFQKTTSTHVAIQ